MITFLCFTERVACTATKYTLYKRIIRAVLIPQRHIYFFLLLACRSKKILESYFQVIAGLSSKFDLHRRFSCIENVLLVLLMLN